MPNHSIVVLSGRSELLDQLRAECPDIQFEGPEGLGGIAVVDSDSAALPSDTSGRFVSRILLDDGGGTRRQQHGDLLVSRSYFLGHPREIVEMAAEVAESVRQAEESQAELRLLREIQELMHLGDAELVSAKIVKSVLRLVGKSRATLLLHDSKVERYVISFTTDPSESESTDFLPGVDKSLLQEALSSSDFYAVSHPGAAEPQLLIPLKIQDDMIGVLIVHLSEGESIAHEAATSAASYTRGVSNALGNVYQLTRSKELAMRDDLTKAFNRRFFESYLDEECERSRRYGTVFSVIFLDLDDLKLVNNRHGHLTGSRMLQEVARRILGAVRGIDKVVRFGGDEFCIILPQTDQDQAHAVAERVRRAISDSTFRLEHDVVIAITASFGIATYPIHAVTKEDLIRQADAAMYRVKSTTKNAIGFALMHPPTVASTRMTQ